MFRIIKILCRHIIHMMYPRQYHPQGLSIPTDTRGSQNYQMAVTARTLPYKGIPGFDLSRIHHQSTQDGWGQTKRLLSKNLTPTSLYFHSKLDAYNQLWYQDETPGSIVLQYFIIISNTLGLDYITMIIFHNNQQMIPNFAKIFHFIIHLHDKELTCMCWPAAVTSGGQ